MIQETKLDESFPIAQFGVDGFTVYRNDNTEHAGGLMMFVRSDIAQIRRYDLEITNCVSGRIESIAIQLLVGGTKWLIISIYKQPVVSNNDFKSSMEILMSKCNSECLKYIVCGDMNINMLLPNNCLKNLMDVYGGGEGVNHVKRDWLEIFHVNCDLYLFFCVKRDWGYLRET